ncbi:MAG: ATP-dependent helicase HrpB [Alkalilacustris sp.]
MQHCLPIDAVLPQVVAALREQGKLVLQAPPGAGKTTRVPLALLDHAPGRIVMLEPRRLAARAAAERMAESLGEPVGRTVGYRIRGEVQVSDATRIEVVTEGILTRRLQSDPELAGIGAVLFDEIHERSLNADLGLALVWEVRGALRPDLWVAAMSATLDAGPIAALMDGAPIVTAEGSAHPVETVWRDRPLPPGTRLEAAMAGQIVDAVATTQGGLLAFLPGEGEIRRTAAALAGRLPADCTIHPLYGALPIAAQRAAIRPAGTGRKIVLATAIAETSLTIEDVRVVVDGGRARRARFDPASGMGRLVTERVSRAEADQRRGRAGRVAPGMCFRLWTRGEEGALPAQAPPEIETADLAGLALELAVWGDPTGAGLAFLTPPPAGPLAEARALLTALGALDGDGRVTAHGRAMAALPLHPRLAHMLLTAGPAAAPLAALLSARDPLRGAGVDLGPRLRALEGRDPALAAVRTEAARLGRLLRGGKRSVAAGTEPPLSPGAMASLAYPDRIGLRRPGTAPRWLLSGGRGAEMDAADPLAGARLIVATDLDGGGREARIRRAVLLEPGALVALHADRITTRPTCAWDARDARVRARIETRLEALLLAAEPWPDAPPEAIARAALDGVHTLGLAACGLGPAARRLQSRVALLRAEGEDLPDVSDEALLETAGDWLLPHLSGCRTAADLAALDLAPAIGAILDWEQQARLDRLAPPVFETPLGRRIPIDYAAGQPTVALRLQEVLGCDTHPTIGPRRLPLRLELLSPAGRPVQVTTDLPGFWRSSYAEVRKDMRGRYPRHDWPEDPTAATPTLRARPRKR